MRVAFYAPLKPPTHPVPSGDRRVGRLFAALIERAGHEVDLVSTTRTYDAIGNPATQEGLRDESMLEARGLLARWAASPETRPDIWFTYHVYYKAPDWLGPFIAKSLGIPYVIAEASYAPKRTNGPWSLGHEATRSAIQAASLVLCPARDDIECVAAILPSRDRVRWFPPFIDSAPYQSALRDRDAHRRNYASAHGLDASVPWIAVVAMMRPGDKAASYRRLAQALSTLGDIPWQLLVAGDGASRTEIQAILERAAPGRVFCLGELADTDVAALYGACDLCLWPAVNEAYGMAMLEAQAAGVPVVSRKVRGVADVVSDGRTGLLSSPDSDEEFAQFARELLTQRERRSAMGRAAAQFAAGERGLDAAVERLEAAFASLAPSDSGCTKE